MLTSFKDKLNAPSQSKTAHNTPPPYQPPSRIPVPNHIGICIELSTTPPGSPPPSSFGAQQPTAPAPNTSSILAALANMARQHQQQPVAPPATTGVNQDSLYSMPNAQINPAQQVAAFNQSMPVSSVAPSVNVPGPGAAFASHLPGANGGVQNYASNLSNPYTAAPAIAPSAALNPAVQQQLVLIKTLSDAGVPPEQIAGIIASLGSQGGAAGGLLPTAQYPSQNQNPGAQPWGAARSDESRDVSAYPGNVRSPAQYRRRSRSPSPHRAWNARDSPSGRRRDESGYDQGRDSPSHRDDRGRGGRGGGRGNDYRQRSPPRRGRSATPPGTYGGGEKWIGHDASIGPGNIKGTNKIISCSPLY
jgi:protein NRD1